MVSRCRKCKGRISNIGDGRVCPHPRVYQKAKQPSLTPDEIKMLIYEIDQWCEDGRAWDSDTSMPSKENIGSAISSWAWLQQRPCSVKEAAKVFNIRPDKVKEAIDYFEGYPVCLIGPPDDFSKLIIEHEGE